MGGYLIHLLSLISGDLSLQGIAAVSMLFPAGFGMIWPLFAGRAAWRFRISGCNFLHGRKSVEGC